MLIRAGCKIMHVPSLIIKQNSTNRNGNKKMKSSIPTAPKTIPKPATMLQTATPIITSINNRRNSKQRFHFKFNSSRIQLTIMCVPALILVALFNYFPMFGLLMAFEHYMPMSGFFHSQWVGLDNFKFFITSQDVWNVTRNTIGYNLSIIIVTTVCSVALALCLYEITGKFRIKVYQTIMFIPYFLSWVVVAYVGYAFLNEGYGVLNNLLQSMGFAPVSWYSQLSAWPYILILASTWKNIGFLTVVYYSALMSVDSELFEAAAIDGATKLKSVWHIALPSIIPVITIMTLMSLGRIFYSDFGLFWYLPQQSGMLFPVTDVIDTYVYRTLKVIGNLGMSSSVNFFQSVLGLITIVFFNFLARKIDKDSSLF
jgi:putative aldouronate transport system permease protein